MFIYETHMHTSTVSVCAVSSPAEQVWAYKNRGYAGIIITDHFVNGNCHCPSYLSWDEKMKFFISGYEEAKAEGDLCGLDVFLGWEFYINGTEFLTYGLDLEFLLEHPGIDKMTAEEYSAVVRGSGGFIVQAHPYRKAFWISSPYPVDHSLVDGIEIYNGGISKDANEKAYQFASRYNLPMLAGSDSHYSMISHTAGIGLHKKAENIHDIIDAIRTKKTKLILPKDYF